jgi:mannan endo-1,4-beta-mannosidase
MRYRSLTNILLLIASFLSCNALLSNDIIPADKKATKETKDLLKKFKNLTAKGIMFGHQDALSYGHSWKDINEKSDVKDVCGDYPAVFGWDLGLIETGSDCNLDSVPFNKIQLFVKFVHQKGGVNTFSWHSNNPATGGNTWDVTNANTVKNILPGNEKHELYKQWLDKLAAFFLGLKDEQGRPIPVFFRPFHENHGSWFWWGEKLCSAEEYVALWKFTFHYLTDIKGVHNLLYAYSPTGTINNKEEYLTRYPGDDYVDMIGIDSYQFSDNSKKFSNRIKENLLILCDIAKEKNKLSAITEIGYESIPDSSWWTGALWKAIENANISYVLVWRNAHNKPSHFYAPHPGHKSEEDFVEFYKLERTLFLRDITP